MVLSANVFRYWWSFLLDLSTCWMIFVTTSLGLWSVLGYKMSVMMSVGTVEMMIARSVFFFC